MPKKKAKASRKAGSSAAKGGERLIVLNERHRYVLWGKGPKDLEGRETTKALATLEFGENLIDAKAWEELSQQTSVKKALARGTMRDAGPVPKGYKPKKDDEEDEEGDEDGAESSDG